MGGRNKLVALVAMGGAGFARLQNPAAAPVAGLSFLSHFQPACQVDTSSSQSLFQVVFGENASSCFALPAFSHSRPLTLLSLVTAPVLLLLHLTANHLSDCYPRPEESLGRRF